MKYILETKLNPDGTFKKAKARKVLQGIKGRFMIKGIHFSVVLIRAGWIYLDHVNRGVCGAVIPGMGSSRDRTPGYVKVLRHPRYDNRVMCWGYRAILSHLGILM